jgi:hypothetical protein
MKVRQSLLALYGKGYEDLALQSLVAVGEVMVENQPLSSLARQQAAKPSLSLPQGERGELQ